MVLKTKEDWNNMIIGKEYNVPTWVLKKIPGYGGYRGVELLNIQSNDKYYWIECLIPDEHTFFRGGFMPTIDFSVGEKYADYIVKLATKKIIKKR